MRKATTPSYVLTLALQTEIYQEHILEKRFEIARKLYNHYLGELLKRVKMMKQDNEYKHWICQEKSKERQMALKDLLTYYGLSYSSIDAFATQCRPPFKKHIDSDTNSKLANRAWEAVSKLIFNKETKKVHFKKFGTMDSVEGKKQVGIRFKEETLYWNGLVIPVRIKKSDMYAHIALQDRVKYCRIVRKQVKGKTRFYVQLILEGIPPKKVNHNTGEMKHLQGKGAVGLDIGTQTIAVASHTEVKLLELAPSVCNIEKEKRYLQRKLDRSRRANNPNKYNLDGTIKKGNKEKWVRSKNYLKTLAKYKEIHNKMARKRKQDHEKMANYILTLGDEIKVETMNFKGLMKRAKETTINENTGKFNRKKRFGKSISNKAPSMLLSILERKLTYQGLVLYKQNTWELKASQYNHVTDSYTKKTLNVRWKDIGGYKIQRDLYSAYLLQHTCNENTYDKESLVQHFEHFVQLHNQEIKRLESLCNNLSSMGV